MSNPDDRARRLFEGPLHKETHDVPELPSVDRSILVNNRITLRTANLVLVCMRSKVGTLDLEDIIYDCLP